jgi:hypothetical protein
LAFHLEGFFVSPLPCLSPAWLFHAVGSKIRENINYLFFAQFYIMELSPRKIADKFRQRGSKYPARALAALLSAAENVEN